MTMRKMLVWRVWNMMGTFVYILTKTSVFNMGGCVTTLTGHKLSNIFIFNSKYFWWNIEYSSIRIKKWIKSFIINFFYQKPFADIFVVNLFISLIHPICMRQSNFRMISITKREFSMLSKYLNLSFVTLQQYLC